MQTSYKIKSHLHLFSSKGALDYISKATECTCETALGDIFLMGDVLQIYFNAHVTWFVFTPEANIQYQLELMNNLGWVKHFIKIK